MSSTLTQPTQSSKKLLLDLTNTQTIRELSIYLSIYLSRERERERERSKRGKEIRVGKRSEKLTSDVDETGRQCTTIPLVLLHCGRRKIRKRDEERERARGKGKSD